MQMFDDQIKDIEEKIMDVVNHMAVKQLGQLVSLNSSQQPSTTRTC